LLNTILGAFSSGVAAATGSYESIATVTATSGNSVTFTSIPGDYEHLQVRAYSICGAGNGIDVKVNNDGGNNYTRHQLIGSGSAVAVQGEANVASWYVAGNNSATIGTYPNVFIMDILDYSSTSKFKTMRSFFGGDANGSGYVDLSSGLWRNTNAITQLQIFSITMSNAQFALYGIKG
jgi:hypothetical protein